MSPTMKIPLLAVADLMMTAVRDMDAIVKGFKSIC